MQITVSLIVDVAEGSTLQDVEAHVVEAGRNAMVEAVRFSVQAYEEEHRICPYCASQDIHCMGTDRRAFTMSFGRVVLFLRRLRCGRCKRRFRPADNYLAAMKMRDKSRAEQAPPLL